MGIMLTRIVRATHEINTSLSDTTYFKRRMISGRSQKRLLRNSIETNEIISERFCGIGLGSVSRHSR